jgi:hypothetical protein
MYSLNDQEKRAFTTIAQSRNGEEILKALQRRKDQLIAGWIANIDPNHGASMRGKVSEVEELIQTISNLSQSKEK